MRVYQSNRGFWSWAAGVALAVGIGVPLALAGGPEYPAKAKVAGARQADWAAAWWQWAYDCPLSSHPLTDTEGVNAAVGQHGPVWFLGGIFSIGPQAPVTRTVTIPEGRAIFFPLMNSTWDNGGVPEVDWITADAMKAGVTAWADGIDTTSLVCTVDGTSVGNLEKHRLVSKAPFSYVVPPGSIYDLFGLTFSGPVYPSFHDGYWVMLKPLPPSEVPHILHFEAVHRDGDGNPDFTIDVTYNINIAPAE